MNIHIPTLSKQAESRGQGYMDRLLSLGVPTNGILEIESVHFQQALKDFPRTEEKHSIKGLGDLIEVIAKPIAKALHMNCLEKDGGLKPGSPCAQRRDGLNKKVPFMKIAALALWILLPFTACAQTSMTIHLQDGRYNTANFANRKIWIQYLSAPTSSQGGTSMYSKIVTNTDANGVLILGNITPGLWSGQVQSPPDSSIFYFVALENQGAQNVEDNLVLKTSNQYVWANSVNKITSTNGSIIIGNNGVGVVDLQAIGGGGGTPFWAAGAGLKALTNAPVVTGYLDTNAVSYIAGTNRVLLIQLDPQNIAGASPGMVLGFNGSWGPTIPAAGGTNGVSIAGTNVSIVYNGSTNVISADVSHGEVSGAILAATNSLAITIGTNFTFFNATNWWVDGIGDTWSFGNGKFTDITRSFGVPVLNLIGSANPTVNVNGQLTASKLANSSQVPLSITAGGNFASHMLDVKSNTTLVAWIDSIGAYNGNAAGLTNYPLNAIGTYGIVPPGSGFPNSSWATDGSGIPAWRPGLPQGFDQITTGTNVQAVMIVGSGANLFYTNSGIIHASVADAVNANQVIGGGVGNQVGDNALAPNAAGNGSVLYKDNGAKVWTNAPALNAKNMTNLPSVDILPRVFDSTNFSQFQFAIANPGPTPKLTIKAGAVFTNVAFTSFIGGLYANELDDLYNVGNLLDAFDFNGNLTFQLNTNKLFLQGISTNNLGKDVTATNFYGKLVGSATSATNAINATNFWGQLSVTNHNNGTAASSSTFLRGDNTWATIPGGGDVLSSGNNVFTGTNTFNGNTAMYGNLYMYGSIKSTGTVAEVDSTLLVTNVGGPQFALIFTNGSIQTYSNIVIGNGGAAFYGLNTGLTNASGQTIATAITAATNGTSASAATDVGGRALVNLVATNDSRNLVLTSSTNNLGTDVSATRFWGDGSHLTGVTGGAGIATLNGIGTNLTIYGDQYRTNVTKWDQTGALYTNTVNAASNLTVITGGYVTSGGITNFGWIKTSAGLDGTANFASKPSLLSNPAQAILGIDSGNAFTITSVTPGLIGALANNADNGTNETIYGTSFHTNWTVMDGNGTRITNNTAANFGVLIQRGNIYADANIAAAGFTNTGLTSAKALATDANGKMITATDGSGLTGVLALMATNLQAGATTTNAQSYWQTNAAVMGATTLTWDLTKHFTYCSTNNNITINMSGVQQADKFSDPVLCLSNSAASGTITITFGNFGTMTNGTPCSALLLTNLDSKHQVFWLTAACFPGSTNAFGVNFFNP